MIKQIIDLLTQLDHYKRCEIIEIAKGKNELPSTIKKGFIQIKRYWKWLRK
jgi:hypothetical protein